MDWRTDPRMDAAVEELRQVIAAHYPEAIFKVAEHDDPEGLYLTAIVDVRGIGLWWGLEFQPSNPTGKSSDAIGYRVERAARHRGLIVRGSPTMVSLAPPLTITHEQIDDMVQRLTLAIEDVMGFVRTESG